MQPSMPEPFRQTRLLCETLDPVHVGTGEFQLGRVDNTIVREAGTNIPKIPGSSIAGVARAYSAMKMGRYPACAGKGGEAGETHCGHANCGICTVYGFAKKKRSFQGLAQFSDARIVFFPVSSATGPVWITSPATLESAGITTAASQPWSDLLGDASDKVALLGSEIAANERLNLGWLYLDRVTGTSRAIGQPAEWKIGFGSGGSALESIGYLGPVLRRLVVVPDTLLPSIVEDQLEVRTSVSISPLTGAAEDGALFTAEAIPRGTFLQFSITFLNPSFYAVPNGTAGNPVMRHDSEDGRATFDDLEETVAKGLAMTEALGLGGVNTRGMGRTRILWLRGAE